MAYLYRHIRLDTNEPFYIGVGGLLTDDGFYRAYKKTNRSVFWKNIVAKTSYKVEIMLNDISYEEAMQREKYFINLYGRRNINTGILVNLTDGGDGCNNMKHSEEIKKIQSQRVSGISHPNYGKTTNDNTKEKIRLKLSGRTNKEHSLRMSNNKNSSKKVVDTITGKVFNSATEAAKQCGIGYSALKAMLNGYNPNKTPLIYLNDFMHFEIKE